MIVLSLLTLASYTGVPVTPDKILQFVIFKCNFSYKRIFYKLLFHIFLCIGMYRYVRLSSMCIDGTIRQFIASRRVSKTIAWHFRAEISCHFILIYLISYLHTLFFSSFEFLLLIGYFQLFRTINNRVSEIRKKSGIPICEIPFLENPCMFHY